MQGKNLTDIEYPDILAEIICENFFTTPAYMSFHSYFISLGYTQNDAHIWKTLYTLGAQPASTIARETGLERTYVYKSLIRLSDDNIISVTEKNGVKNFFISDSSVLLKKAKSEKERYNKLESEYLLIASELESLNQKDTKNIPKISIYEGKIGIENLYTSMENEIMNKKYREILLFASNITESCGGSATLSLYARDFLESMDKQHISINTYIGNGISLLESIGQLSDIESMKNLPASDGSFQCYIVGGSFYMMIFKGTSFGMRIESDELSGLFRFLIEQTQK